MTALGAFTFIVHSHQPYVRLGGRWDHGEEWIHDTILETYLPLLNTLYDLKDEGTIYHLTVGFSPVLAEQLADPLVLGHFAHYLDERIEMAQKDVAYFEKEAYNEHLRYLADTYRQLFQRTKTTFTERFNGDLIGAFRRLQDEGLLDLITSAATYAYLPLLASDGSLNAQVKMAVTTHQRLFGRAPGAFWLPDYGYRPAQITETGLQRPGIEHFLAANGIRAFFVDTHTLTGDTPLGPAAGKAIGSPSGIKRRYVLPASVLFRPDKRDVSPFVPYDVGESGVAVIGRNARADHQVWGTELGYPGDFDYRDPSRRAGTSSLPYWRVTGAKVEPSNKDYYHPDWAAYKIEQHAEHFAHLVGDQLRSYNQATGGYGLLAASFSADLFGHWWFEGVAWLGKVLRHLANNPDVDLTSAADYVAQRPPQQSLTLPESSWGIGGLHFLWDNPENHWMWLPIHAAEDRMEQLAERFTAPSDAETLVLQQTAREALLLQSADWLFMVTTGQGRAYAIRRFSEHVERFERLAASLEAGQPDVSAAQGYGQQDQLFADIDYRWFNANKQSAED